MSCVVLVWSIECYTFSFVCSTMDFSNDPLDQSVGMVDEIGMHCLMISNVHPNWFAFVTSKCLMNCLCVFVWQKCRPFKLHCHLSSPTMPLGSITHQTPITPLPLSIYLFFLKKKKLIFFHFYGFFFFSFIVNACEELDMLVIGYVILSIFLSITFTCSLLLST